MPKSLWTLSKSFKLVTTAALVPSGNVKSSVISKLQLPNNPSVLFWKYKTCQCYYQTVKKIVYMFTMKFHGRYTLVDMKPSFSITSTPAPDSNIIITSD